MFKDRRHMIEFGVGIAVILSMLLFGILYNTEKVYANLGRLLVGGLIGYALARSAFGFAGTVNRACQTGSTKLMKAVSVLFLLGGVVTCVMVLGGFGVEKLSHIGITWGLVIGATLFGFGMAFTVCCASGVFTDLAETPLKGLFALLFMGLGAFLGLGLKKAEWMKWIKEPFLGIPGAEKGSNFTEWFSWDGTKGILFSLIFTALLVAGVYALSHLYENFRKKKGTYVGCRSEISYDEEKATHVPSENKINEAFYNAFVKPWSLTTSAVVIAGGYALLMIIFKSGWGVSGPIGQWFARLIGLFGVPADAIKGFSGVDITTKFFDQAMYIQDLSIFLGALIAFLFAGNFTRNMKSWLFNPLELVLYAVGGVILGIGFTIAGGCNAGGLFTPIAQFGVSGWIYLVFLVIGGFGGNWVRKQWQKLYKDK